MPAKPIPHDALQGPFLVRTKKGTFPVQEWNDLVRMVLPFRVDGSACWIDDQASGCRLSVQEVLDRHFSASQAAVAAPVNETEEILSAAARASDLALVEALPNPAERTSVPPSSTLAESRHSDRSTPSDRQRHSRGQSRPHRPSGFLAMAILGALGVGAVIVMAAVSRTSAPRSPPPMPSAVADVGTQGPTTVPPRTRDRQPILRPEDQPLPSWMVRSESSAPSRARNSGGTSAPVDASRGEPPQPAAVASTSAPPVVKDPLLTTFQVTDFTNKSPIGEPIPSGGCLTVDLSLVPSRKVKIRVRPTVPVREIRMVLDGGPGDRRTHVERKTPYHFGGDKGFVQLDPGTYHLEASMDRADTSETVVLTVDIVVR